MCVVNIGMRCVWYFGEVCRLFIRLLVGIIILCVVFDVKLVVSVCFRGV